jgi:hypothetical protein
VIAMKETLEFFSGKFPALPLINLLKMRALVYKEIEKEKERGEMRALAYALLLAQIDIRISELEDEEKTR